MADRVTIYFDGQPLPLIRDIDAINTSLEGIGGEAQESFNEIEDYATGASKDFEEMRRDLDKVGDELDDVGKRSTKSGSMIKSAMKGLAAGAATGGVLLGFQALQTGISAVAGAFPATIQLAQEQAEAERKLEAVLESTGHAAGFSAEQLKGHASQLQTLTGVGDEATLGVQSLLATFRNVRGDTFLQTTEMALDMADILGGDATSAAMTLGKALNDPAKGLSKLTEAGVTFSEEQHELVAEMIAAGDVAGAQGVILDELGNQFGGAARSKMEGFSGALQLITGRLGDLGERVGAVLIKGLEMAWPYFDGTVVALENMMGWFEGSEQSMGVFGRAIANIMEAAKSFAYDVMVPATAAVEHVWSNLTFYFEKSALEWQLSFTTIGETASHWLGTVLPDLVNWFSDNWAGVLTDLLNFHNTVYGNMFDNAVEFFTSIWDYLAGNEGSFEFKGLTEGFESSLKELPEIAAREVTATEKDLAARIQRISTRLDNDFADTLMTRRQQFEDLFKKGDAEELDLESNAEPIDLGNVGDKDADKEKKKDEEQNKDKEKVEVEVKEKDDQEKEGTDSKEEDAESLYARIADSAAGVEAREDARHNAEMQKWQEDLNKQQEALQALHRIADMLPNAVKNMDVKDLAPEKLAFNAGEMLAEMPGNLMDMAGDALGNLNVGAMINFDDMQPRKEDAEKPVVNIDNDAVATPLKDLLALAQGIGRALPLRGTLQ